MNDRGQHEDQIARSAPCGTDASDVLQQAARQYAAYLALASIAADLALADPPIQTHYDFSRPLTLVIRT